jgi:hypothetical protein
VRFGIDVAGWDEVRASLNQLGRRDMNSIELNQWAGIVERTAKQICDDNERIELKARDNTLHVRYEDEISRECLIKAIHRHLPLMPIIIQSIFRKLVSDLKSGAFTQ